VLNYATGKLTQYPVTAKDTINRTEHKEETEENKVKERR
jgi:hypothetical protein